MTGLKFVIMIAGAAGLIGLMYFLYMRQLGAISFFLLAVLFFSLSFASFNEGDKKGKFLIRRRKKRR